MHLSLPMALADFVPVGLFLAASVLLQRDLYNKMSKGAFALLQEAPSWSFWQAPVKPCGSCCMPSACVISPP